MSRMKLMELAELGVEPESTAWNTVLSAQPGSVISEVRAARVEFWCGFLFVLKIQARINNQESVGIDGTR